MPGGDRTGPFGYGPMTGRRMGYCAGYDRPGFAQGFGGYGGWGWRHRNMYYATGLTGWQRAGYAPSYRPAPFYGPVSSEKEELSMLKNQAEYFEKALDDIRRRIQELEERQTKEND